MSGDKSKEVNPMIFIVKPRKSITRICEEYNVEFTDEELKKLANMIVDVLSAKRNEMEGKCIKLIEYLESIGKRHNLSDEKLIKFIRDTIHTLLFYARTLHYIKLVIGG